MLNCISVKDAPRVSNNVLQDVEKTRKKTARKLEKHNIPLRTDAQKKVGLFSHLHQYEREVSLTRDIKYVQWCTYSSLHVFCKTTIMMCPKCLNCSISILYILLTDSPVVMLKAIDTGDRTG